MTLTTPVAVCPPSVTRKAAEQQLPARRATLSDWKGEMDGQWKGCLFIALLVSSALCPWSNIYFQGGFFFFF